MSAYTLKDQAWELYRQGLYQEAGEKFRQAKERAEEDELWALRIEAIYGESDCMMTFGRHEDAIAILLDGASDTREGIRTSDRLNCYTVLVEACMYVREYDEIRRYLDATWDFMRTAGGEQWQHILWCLEADLASRRGDFEAARDASIKAFQTHQTGYPSRLKGSIAYDVVHHHFWCQDAEGVRIWIEKWPHASPSNEQIRAMAHVSALMKHRVDETWRTDPERVVDDARRALQKVDTLQRTTDFLRDPILRLFMLSGQDSLFDRQFANISNKEDTLGLVLKADFLVNQARTQLELERVDIEWERVPDIPETLPSHPEARRLLDQAIPLYDRAVDCARPRNERLGSMFAVEDIERCKDHARALRRRL